MDMVGANPGAQVSNLSPFGHQLVLKTGIGEECFQMADCAFTTDRDGHC